MWKECNVCSSYLVSDTGEIKSKKTGKILKQKLDKGNSLLVNLSFGKKYNQKYFIVARLVAEAFIPNPDNLPWVKHIDGNTINNNVNNLKWTKCEHISQLRGETAPNSKLTKEQVEYCRNVYKPRDKKFGMTPLAKKFNIGKSTMSYILNNITYK